MSVLSCGVRKRGSTQALRNTTQNIQESQDHVRATHNETYWFLIVVYRTGTRGFANSGFTGVTASAEEKEEKKKEEVANFFR